MAKATGLKNIPESESRKMKMSASNPPLRYALLVAALMQILPVTASAAKADKEDEDAGKICDDCPDASGWTKWVEVGAGVLSDDSYHFGRYTGQADSGGYTNADAEVSYRAKSNGGYLNAKVIDLGLDSREVVVEAGRQGKYGVTVEYDQIPNFRKQYDSGVSLKTERNRAGIKFSAIPGRDWAITGYYRHEKKDGTKDVGATFGYSPTAILPVAFDYQTDDFGLNLGYKGERMQAQIAYAGSLFKSDSTGIDWANPNPANPDGRIAEAPDNQSHQISAMLGYQWSEHTRIGGKLALGRMTQDQAFLPYGTTYGLSTPGSLDGQVDTALAQFNINSRPSPRLRLDASYTYSNRDNKTPVNTYDYVITDTILSPDARQNRPYSFKQNLLRLKAGYKLRNDMDLSGGYDYDDMDRSYQQVAETRDQTVWARIAVRPAETVETTLKISRSARDASAAAVSSPEAAYQNPSFPESGVIYSGTMAPNPLMLAFELADRNRDKVGFDVSYQPLSKLSLGLGLDYYKDDYKDMELGLTKATGLTATPSLTYVFSERLSASAYYTYDKLSSDQTGREWVSGLTTSPWVESDGNTTQTVGLSANWKAIPDKLDLGADLVYADFTGKIHYDSTPLPDLSAKLTSLGIHGTYKLKENLTLRADFRHERYKESDWANVALPSALVDTLGTTPQEQKVNLIYLSVRYTFK